MSGLFDQVPGLAGYQRQVQLNQQQDSDQLNKLAQVLGLQEGQMKMDAMRRKLAVNTAMGKALQEAYASKTNAPVAQPFQDGAQGTYSAGGSMIGNTGEMSVPVAQPTPSVQAESGRMPSAADTMMAAAIKAGDYESYQEAQKLKLEEKKAAAKFATKPEVVMGPDGKPMLVQMADDGTVRPISGGYGPAEKLHFADNGQQIVGLDQYTGLPTSPAIRKQATPGELLTDARARDQQETGRVPLGYRKGPDGNLQAIPGGPADMKIQGQFNQDTAAVTSSMSAMDRLAIAANEAMNHPGLAGTAGIRGVVPNIPGSQAADAAALMNTLKSQVAFGVLQDMRNNSKTGGALGNVSDAEGKRLEANLAALEKSQSVEQLRDNLKKIIDYTQGAKDRLGKAYNLRYSTAQGSGANLNPPADVGSATATGNPSIFQGSTPAAPSGFKIIGVR